MVQNGLPAIHPGEYLAELLEDLGLSQAQFARLIGISPGRISYIVKGLRPVTAELALLFGKAFGQSAHYWLNLQAEYDLKAAQKHLGPRLASIHVCSPHSLAV
ncbi:MAG: antitoxin HigA [Pseudomonadota bacterium]|nr:antitoxin HigA [Pseudomonadota bacterium]